MPVLKVEQKVSQVVSFRKNMGVPMPKEKVVAFWGERYKDISGVENSKRVKYIEKKKDLVKKNIGNMLFLDWVKFISITGSVAAGTAQEKDDVDVFIVVKNNRMWLYRAFLTMKLGRKSLRRVWGKPVKDKIDTNFICEERGLWFNTKSIFELHELLFMIPVYNEEYYENILNINYKLLENYSIRRKKEGLNNESSFFLKFLDKLAFILQYIYMLFKRHKPDYSRLTRNNKKGRIEFFPKDFSKKKVKEFEEEFNQA